MAVCLNYYKLLYLWVCALLSKLCNVRISILVYMRRGIYI